MSDLRRAIGGHSGCSWIPKIDATASFVILLEAIGLGSRRLTAMLVLNMMELYFVLISALLMQHLLLVVR